MKENKLCFGQSKIFQFLQYCHSRRLSPPKLCSSDGLSRSQYNGSYRSEFRYFYGICLWPEQTKWRDAFFNSPCECSSSRRTCTRCRGLSPCRPAEWPDSKAHSTVFLSFGGGWVGAACYREVPWQRSGGSGHGISRPGESTSTQRLS